MASQTKQKLFIGTSGWSYEDWKDMVYPSAGQRHALEYMARYFNALEINVSFYRPISPSMAESWVRRTAGQPHFQFAAKLLQRFTHQRSEPISNEEVSEWLDGIRPLQEAGKLGAALAQFPWSFKNRPEERDWLKFLCDRFGQLPLVVELRHDSWLTDEGLDVLRSLGVGFCNIDQPPHDHCIGPTDLVLSSVGYVRLHGRNRAKWFEHEEAYERYDYLYTEKELADWLPRIRKITERAGRTFVFANNHYRGQAVVNALQLRAMLEGRPVEVPELLLRAYPQLARLAKQRPTQCQGRLF